jgi:hypothetical protein
MIHDGSESALDRALQRKDEIANDARFDTSGADAYVALCQEARAFGMKVDTLQGLKEYWHDRRDPGDFLRAVLENNLAKAIGRADRMNLAMLQDIVAYVHNYLPAVSWGSPEAVQEWLR